jgi:uncharacterized protein YbbK (DUF523 family)
MTRRALTTAGMTLLTVASMVVVAIVIVAVSAFVLAHLSPTCGIAATSPNC